MKEGGIQRRTEMPAATILREAPTLAGFNPAQHEEYRVRTEQKLNRIYGASTLERLADAQRLINEVEAKRPGLKTWLSETGLGNNFNAVYQAAELARRKYGKS